MRGRLASFLGDDRGAVASIFAVALVGLVAVGALGWDISRGFALRGELDSAVDAAALAGASQLDGLSGAQDRATEAATTAFLTNAQRLGDTAEANVLIQDADIAFLQDLTTRAIATGDDNAEFIEINLPARNLGLVLGALSTVTDFQVRAHAVAGLGKSICLVPPLMICNPNESADPTFENTAIPGVATEMRMAPQSGDWNPGNFGFLQVNDAGSANAIADALARVTPLAQCYGEEVTTAPGAKQSVMDSFNMRFDMYRTNTMQKNEGKSADYQPALNTIIGKSTKLGDACAPTPVPTPSITCPNPAAGGAMGLPPDCNQPSSGFGSGLWDWTTYFTINHSISLLTSVDWSQHGPNGPHAPNPTRYQVYNWEKKILSTEISPPPAGSFSKGQDASSGIADFAKPTCYSGPTPTQQDPDRRTITALVLNCNGPPQVKGKTSGVAVISGIDLFLLAPVVEKGSVATMYAEVIAKTTVSSEVGATTMHYTVRLYE